MRLTRLAILPVLLGLGLTLGAQTAPPVAPVTAPKPPPDLPALPSPLPGRGLAQHDFLYCGEFDTRFDVQTMSLIKGGKVVWTYQIPTRDTNGRLSEFSDMHLLSNGDIVFAYKTGWRKINQAKQTLFDFKCPRETAPDGKEYWRECHTAEPIGLDRVMYVLNGAPAKLFIYNLKSGQIEVEHVLTTKNPGSSKVHGQFRNVRMTKAGTYLIAHMDLHRVIEYDRNWKEIWSCDAPSVWHAVRLDNGNTLFSGNQNAFAREVNPKGETVWEVKDGDFPGIKLLDVHEAIRLANGNTIITNWCAGSLSDVNRALWPKTAQLIEVTPDKKLVWVLSQWSNPDLGPASCIQVVDEPGKDENQELMR